ncbi:hypothetical protein [Vibrio crassostreae]|uniref:hypothetical protein n=1 Tax=Vibrio crassostreae TaxID=246167 RepID=UPI001B3181CE|nr:hypothetical protein [Vibrio crassostreae]
MASFFSINGFYTVFCFSCLVVSATSSAYLSADFMYSFGATQTLAMIFALMGISLDLTKSFLPSIISELRLSRSTPRVLLGLAYITMLSLSFFASVYSLETGVEKAKVTTFSAMKTERKIDVLESEIADLKQLQKSQLLANHITKADFTSIKIAEKSNQLLLLIEGSGSVSSEGDFILNNSSIVTKVVAASIEVLTLVMSYCLYALRDQSRSQFERDVSTPKSQDIITSLPAESNIKHSDDMLVASCERSSELEILCETPKVKSRVQVLEELKVSLATRNCKPNHRSIRSKFKEDIPQRQVKSYLLELADQGFLRHNPNGTFELAIY